MPQFVKSLWQNATPLGYFATPNIFNANVRYLYADIFCLTWIAEDGIPSRGSFHQSKAHHSKTALMHRFWRCATSNREKLTSGWRRRGSFLFSFKNNFGERSAPDLARAARERRNVWGIRDETLPKL